MAKEISKFVWKGMNDLSNDIKRYLGGEMTPAERHAFEKKALSDPFLADALEGVEQITSQDLTSDLAALHNQLDQKIKQENSTKKLWSWGLRLAAGLSLIFIAISTVWYLLDQPQEFSQLSSTENKKDQTTTLSNIDSTTLANTKDQLAMADQLQSTQSTPSSGSAQNLPTQHNKTGVVEEVEETADIEIPAPNNPIPTSEAQSQEAVEGQSLPLNQVTKAEKESQAIADVFKTDEMAKRSVKRTDAPSAVSFSDNKNNTTISGKIVSAEDGSALPGVNVLIKGTSTGTISDVNGNYTIETAKAPTTLVFSFIGLQSKEVPVINNTTIDVAMNLDVSQLSEVVVTGYGYSEKSESTPTLDLAQPIGGSRVYKKYLEENLRYPALALKNKVEGRVTVEFFVEIDGHLTEFKVIRGIGSGCDEELIRLIKEGPAWTPTQKDALAIRDKARVRLKFELPKE